MNRKAYPSDVSDEEWALVAPYLTLMREDAPQREYELREVFNGLRYVIKTDATWRMVPHDLPPWEVIYQQSQRWLKAGVFEALVHDLREILRLVEGRKAQPSAAIFDSRTLQSSPESGAKRKRGSKVHMAVDTLGHLLALMVTPANEQDRQQVEELARQVQDVTGQSVEIAFVDQGYTGDQPQQDAAQFGIQLEVVKLPDASVGLFFSPAGGSLSVVLAGSVAFDAWQGTMNACLKLWLVFISWLLLSFCSTVSFSS
jgi:transposase